MGNGPFHILSNSSSIRVCHSILHYLCIYINMNNTTISFAFNTFPSSAFSFSFIHLPVSSLAVLAVFSVGCPSFTLLSSLSKGFSHIPFTLPDFHDPSSKTFMAEWRLPLSVALTSAGRRKLIVVLHQIFAESC